MDDNNNNNNRIRVIQTDPAVKPDIGTLHPLRLYNERCRFTNQYFETQTNRCRRRRRRPTTARRQPGRIINETNWFLSRHGNDEGGINHHSERNDDAENPTVEVSSRVQQTCVPNYAVTTFRVPT